MQAKRRAYLFLAWLLVSAVFLGSWLFTEIAQQRQAFQTQSQRLYTGLQQRVDQNKALLLGIGAFLKSHDEHIFENNFESLRRYTSDILQNYPHIYAIEWQPYVTNVQRPAFEAAMRRYVEPNFGIKDYDQQKNLHPAGSRSFYYPVVFVAPDLPQTKSILGVDISYLKEHGRPVIATIPSQIAIADPILNLIKGGRGYLLLKSIELKDGINNLGTVSLVINTERVFPEILSPLDITLVNKSHPSPEGVIFESDKTRSTLVSRFIPDFLWEKDIDIDKNKFTLYIKNSFSADAWQLLPLLALPLLALLLITFGNVLIQQKEHRRHADIAIFRAKIREKELAMAAEMEKRLREREAELNHTNRFNTMGEMAAGIAHEINQPLSAILSYNEACLLLLEKENPEINTLRSAMKAATIQARQAGAIITRLRTFMSKSIMPLQLTTLQDVVADVLLLQHHELLKNNIKVDNKFPEEPLLIYGDPVQLTQVLLNILRNALDAMMNTENPTVQLRGETDSEQVRLYISDNGHGLSPTAHDHLFHPFFTTKLKGEGLGLGLSISTRIIEQHGGRLSASNNPGGGAVLCISLPKAKPDN